MDTCQQLIDNIIEVIHTKEYVKKPEKEFIRKNIGPIRKYANAHENKCIDRMIKIVSASIKALSAIRADDRQILRNIEKPIMTAIEKYKDDLDAEDSTEDSTEDNTEDSTEDSTEDVEDDSDGVIEDDTEVDLTPDAVERKLDNAVPKYRVYDKDHPMKGVTYSGPKKKYQVKLGDIDTYSIDLSVACKKIMESHNLKKSKTLSERSVNEKKSFRYLNYFFISYWDKNEPYFDIQHIISSMDLKESSWRDKYAKFKSKIVHYIWHKNEYGGYILRELINETTMYELYLSSNCDLSVSFKKDVAKIITELRKAGKLEITGEHIALKKEPIETIYYDDEPVVLTRNQHIINHQKYPDDRQLQAFTDNKAYFDYLTHKEDLQHAETMKDKDLALKDKDIALKDKDLALRDKDIRLEGVRLQIEEQKQTNIELQLRAAKLYMPNNQPSTPKKTKK